MTSEDQRLTHLDDRGRARMVDVGSKANSEREATAEASVVMDVATLEILRDETNPKGDVLAVARIAGIQAAKQCGHLIPLCHPLMLTSVVVELDIAPDLPGVLISATCRVTGPTGVEMEALTAVSVAALTIYDMCKAVDRGMVISNVQLREKRGGASGHWQRD